MKLVPTTKEQFYEIAKIIDNDFNGTFETFTHDRKMASYNRLTTNKADSSSIIRVYHDNNSINAIERIGEDTISWQPIHDETMNKVNQYLTSLS